jgi:hypothetical protein
VGCGRRQDQELPVLTLYDAVAFLCTVVTACNGARLASQEDGVPNSRSTGEVLGFIFGVYIRVSERFISTTRHISTVLALTSMRCVLLALNPLPTL